MLFERQKHLEVKPDEGNVLTDGVLSILLEAEVQVEPKYITYTVPKGSVVDVVSTTGINLPLIDGEDEDKKTITFAFPRRLALLKVGEADSDPNSIVSMFNNSLLPVFLAANPHLKQGDLSDHFVITEDEFQTIYFLPFFPQI